MSYYPKHVQTVLQFKCLREYGTRKHLSVTRQYLLGLIGFLSFLNTFTSIIGAFSHGQLVSNISIPQVPHQPVKLLRLNGSVVGHHGGLLAGIRHLTVNGHRLYGGGQNTIFLFRKLTCKTEYSQRLQDIFCIPSISLCTYFKVCPLTDCFCQRDILDQFHSWRQLDIPSGWPIKPLCIHYNP